MLVEVLEADPVALGVLVGDGRNIGGVVAQDDDVLAGETGRRRCGYGNGRDEGQQQEDCGERRATPVARRSFLQDITP